MRPITRQSREYYWPVRLTGYRMLAFWVIGAILIGLLVISLSKISENILGRDSAGRDLGGTDAEIKEKIKNYYPGVLGMLRKTRTGSESPPGQDIGRIVQKLYVDGI
jgi:hypothetical protein